jgi:hypothetical protein
MGEKIRVYMILVGKPERKRWLVGPRHEWEDSINMDLYTLQTGIFSSIFITYH